MKRREFLKGALLGAGLCLIGETAARQAIGATQVPHVVEPPKSAGKPLLKYVWSESEKCYNLVIVNPSGNMVYLPADPTKSGFRSYATRDSLYPAVAVR